MVEEFFLKVNRTLNIPEEKLHALLVAATEAVNNGIIHGNESNSEKNVTLTCTLKRKTLTVKIKDEGEGFVPEKIADPLQEDNVLKTGGRGVFLMKTFMHSVKYNKRGNEVTLTMKL